MTEQIVALFASSKKIGFKDLYKMMGVNESNMCDNLIEDISDAIEDLMRSGTIELDSTNYLVRR